MQIQEEHYKFRIYKLYLKAYQKIKGDLRFQDKIPGSSLLFLQSGFYFSNLVFYILITYIQCYIYILVFTFI